MVICVSADHKNPVWKLFKLFPSWNRLERLQTTLPYALVAYGLMHAMLLFLHYRCPPLPWQDQQCCRNVFAIGVPWHSLIFSPVQCCSFLQLFAMVMLPTSCWMLPAPPGTHNSTHTKPSVLPPTVTCFFLLFQKPPQEAFQSKQNECSASAGKFYFISLFWTRTSWIFVF